MKKYLKATVAFSALVCATTALAAAPAWAGKNKGGGNGNGGGGQQEETGGGNNGADDQYLFSFRGDIDPFRGDINPFHGDINPFRGDINPFYGDISPFWGDISPFWGDINPFHGDINPFHGDISPFWGDISPWRGDIDPFYGDINPFWGDIGPFWGDIGPFWGDLNAQWGDIDPFSDAAGDQYERVADSLRGMLRRAGDVFGAAVEHETGQSIEDAVFAELLARYGVNLDDPRSLENMDAAERSRFFLDFYDSLMGYTGLDRVDHWMASVNWTPALSQAAGGGTGVYVGLLDFNFSSSEALNVRRKRGNELFYDFAHGAAVASLINAPMDGEGVMGVAPNALLQTYNPFDDSLTTNWRDVRNGVVRLLRDHSQVINISLGLPGTTFAQQWRDDVFSSKHVRQFADRTVFVFAAGNDGYTQDFDVEWRKDMDVSNLIIVGSVDPNNNISSFSNRPGEACFTVRGRCNEGFRLMDRFLVAPGELILVSDGNGGVIRQSGTSFAAPLVSGAAALVRGRWGWIGARDTADVLLRSARDLGAPGTDPVYGRGLLDVQAAMSPLDPDSLYIMTAGLGRHDVGAVKYASDRLTFHSADENSVVLFEDLNDTFRDFVVSLDELNGRFTQEELDSAINAEQYLAEREAAEDAASSFRDTGEYAVTMTGRGNLRVSAVASRLDPRDRASEAELGFQVGVRIADDEDGREVRFGLGEGALALTSQSGFGLFSDHRPETGGVNPVLGFASGGLYGVAGLEVSENTRLSFGLTINREEDLAVMPHSGEERSITGLDAYEAAAFNITAEHDVREGLELSVSYTLLREDTGFLGAQGTGPLDLSGGAMTDAATFGVSMAMPMQVNLDASATLARSRTGGFGNVALNLSEAAISTAFQVTASRQGVMSDRDAVRVSLIQPLHVESGAMEYSTARVTDRETGTMEGTTETWRLGGERPLFAEAMYATSLIGGSTQFSVYTRAQLAGDAQAEDVRGITAGGRIRFTF
ncbi:S8 family peptidase [Hyphobacterium sp.]|uniref:S8 family peptidase n=1 Tax=Hyphobacterium sp. TaxID=2004662 RepID=UPI003B51585C